MTCHLKHLLIFIVFFPSHDRLVFYLRNCRVLCGVYSVLTYIIDFCTLSVLSLSANQGTNLDAN